MCVPNTCRREPEWARVRWVPALTRVSRTFATESWRALGIFVKRPSEEGPLDVFLVEGVALLRFRCGRVCAGATVTSRSDRDSRVLRCAWPCPGQVMSRSFRAQYVFVVTQGMHSVTHFARLADRLICLLRLHLEDHDYEAFCRVLLAAQRGQIAPTMAKSAIVLLIWRRDRILSREVKAFIETCS